MSETFFGAFAARPGRLACACPAPAEASFADASDVRRLSVGFALSALAQTLSLTLLPIAGLKLAPSPALASAPYALTLAGAAFASLPASMLVDLFGRRAAFALGASLGTAGGLLAARAIFAGNFALLCLGGLWIGAAQGFALFYRHAAAASAGEARQALNVLAGGVAASLAAPTVIALCQAQFGPLADMALALATGLASFAALPFLLTLPHDLRKSAHPAADAAPARYWQATVVGVVSWFAMAMVMARAPISLAGCGLGAALIGAFVSWHLLAMYAPIALAARYAWPTRASLILGLGLLGAALVWGRGDATRIEAGLICAGIGWSLAQVAATRWLHGGRAPSRLALGAHDGAILGAALAGALLAGAFPLV